MCRILGYFGEKFIPQEVINRAIKRQINGGPDGQYLEIGNGWAISNNRLAIQDLKGGIQPFHLNKMYAVYNGEIYNYQKLKIFLATKGYSFKDDCDGSVILPLYEVYGEDFVKYLDGMFAIAIIDERNGQKIILASDPNAIKSLYYHHDSKNGMLFFASELGALFEFPVSQEIRAEAINEYLIGRALWHNKSFFKNVDSLGPGGLLIKEKNRAPEVKTYESKEIEKYDGVSDFAHTSQWFNQLFNTEIQKMLHADVPVCLVTSGGLDSSYVSALAAKHLKKLECFNIAYEGTWPADERHFAKEVADFCGIKYNQVLIKESEFPRILEKTIEHLGQPNSAPHSLSTYALFEAIHQAGFKVAVTGEGADEFFGGYERFKKATFDMDVNWAEKYFDVMCATTDEMRQLAYSENYRVFLRNPNEMLENAASAIKLQETNLSSRLKAILQFDQKERFTSYILRRVDHLSMANAVEVRVPFCQPKISSFASSLPDDYLVDKNAVKKIIYGAARNLLPESIIKRPKQPFTLPITAMLKPGHILFEIMNDTLHSEAFKRRGFFETSQINILIDRQINTPNSNVADLLWSIMVLELWLQAIQPKFRLGA